MRKRGEDCITPSQGACRQRGGRQFARSEAGEQPTGHRTKAAGEVPQRAAFSSLSSRTTKDALRRSLCFFNPHPARRLDRLQTEAREQSLPIWQCGGTPPVQQLALLSKTDNMPGSNASAYTAVVCVSNSAHSHRRPPEVGPEDRPASVPLRPRCGLGHSQRNRPCAAHPRVSTLRCERWMDQPAQPAAPQ
jgi:hypothetical protein